MALPTVAIIGRPNVGKSSLLNALAGERISIVEPTPGVTRDRISTIIEIDDRYFELVDTGGYGVVDVDQLTEHVENQINQAIAAAELVVFMTDIRQGLLPLDKKIARLLRKQNLPVIGVANKADTHALFADLAEFTPLGFGEFLPISVTNNLNKSVLIEEILERLGSIETRKPAEPVMKIALVGKRNTGKSTIVNTIARSERVIVSETPGTTRDAVDVRIERDGETFLVIDTAGVRRKGKMSGTVEFYGYIRATNSIRRADVILFLIDSTVPISRVDKKLSKFITDNYKSCILVINKWDLAKDNAVEQDYEDYLTKILPGLRDVPIAFTTATRGENVEQLLRLAGEIYTQANTKIPTPRLNRAFETIKQQPVTIRNTGQGRPKIYYAAQIAANPVTILMFVNNPRLFDETYRRFIIKRLKAILELEEVPIRLLARAHRKPSNQKVPRTAKRSKR